MDKIDNKKVSVAFSALYPVVTTNIVEPTEVINRGREVVQWGIRNNYPNYVYDLYRDCTTLKSIVNGIADYVVGDGVESQNSIIKSTEVEDLVRNITIDYGLYGGFTLEVKRGLNGNVIGINYVNIANIRTNKKNTEFYYSEEWHKSMGRCNYITLPRFEKFRDFDENNKPILTSIFLFKSCHNSIYPQSPMGGSALYSAEVAKSISQYHLNNIKNSFSANYIINLNGGKPDDDLKEEIEENFNEKFCGESNSGRLVLSFNNSKEEETTIAAIPADNFQEKYAALEKSSKEDLFSAYRVAPVLFGRYQEGTGFNDQDYQQAFKLANRTVIKPVQKIIINSLDNILNIENSIIIKPFTIDWE